MESESGEPSLPEQARAVTARELWPELPFFACGLLPTEQDERRIQQQQVQLPASAATNALSLRGIDTASEAMSAYGTPQNEDLFSRCTETTKPTDVVPSASGDKAEDGEDVLLPLKGSTCATYWGGSPCRTAVSSSSSSSDSSRQSSPGPESGSLYTTHDQFDGGPVPREEELDLSSAACSSEWAGPGPNGLTIREIGMPLGDANPRTLSDVLQAVEDM